jgi:hypothetical protein
MTRKNACRLLASVMVAVIAFSVWTYFRTMVTRRSFNKIQVGMTENQVRELLGTPAWNSNAVPGHPLPYSLYYSGPGCSITIDFNAAGEVANMDFEEYPNQGWAELDWRIALLTLFTFGMVLAILVVTAAAWRYCPPQNESTCFRHNAPETTRRSDELAAILPEAIRLLLLAAVLILLVVLIVGLWLGKI